MQLVTFGINSTMNFVIQFPVFIQPYTQKPINFISTGDSSSSYFGSKYQSSILQTFENQKALYSFKFRNIHLTQRTRTKIMQEDRL